MSSAVDCGGGEVATNRNRSSPSLRIGTPCGACTCRRTVGPELITVIDTLSPILNVVDALTILKLFIPQSHLWDAAVWPAWHRQLLLDMG